MRRLDLVSRAAAEKLPRGILALRFGTVIKEIMAFLHVVDGKLPPVSVERLRRLAEGLEPIANSGEHRKITWSTVDGPIETYGSDGGHQPGRVGHGRSLKGVVNFTWEIQTIGARLKHPENRLLALWNSSVRVRLVDIISEGEVVASWDFDIGNHQSPGCHFHAKFAHPNQAERELLKDVDVPRLPSFIFMPTDAIEFVIGELWQDDWRKTAASGTREVEAWRHYPKHRFKRLLEWYSSELSSTRGTPWVQLKCAKPEALILLEER
jgi:hypothetical protein